MKSRSHCRRWRSRISFQTFLRRYSASCSIRYHNCTERLCYHSTKPVVPPNVLGSYLSYSTETFASIHLFRCQPVWLTDWHDYLLERLFRSTRTLMRYLSWSLIHHCCHSLTHDVWHLYAVSLSLSLICWFFFLIFSKYFNNTLFLVPELQYIGN